MNMNGYLSQEPVTPYNQSSIKALSWQIANNRIGLPQNTGISPLNIDEDGGSCVARFKRKVKRKE
jgi:hypothetical protein